jgi:2-dehydropantoate 2-reductase
MLRYGDGVSQPRGGIDVELVEPDSTAEGGYASGEHQGPIRHLIVSVLASQTIRALAPIKHRLDPKSTVLFLQNGMGSPEEAARKFFPNAGGLPYFMQGIVLPGGWTLEPFVVQHAARGTLPVGKIPRQKLVGSESAVEETSATEGVESSRYLIDILSQSPILAAKEVDYTELVQQQLEKLAINIVANPLTGILNESNAVLQQPALAPLIRALVEETASIIRALPELKSVPSAQERFSAQRLEDRVMGYLGGVQANTTSMCQHLRAGKKTEVEYINGYMVQRAREIGAPCVLNSALRQLVLTKEAVGNGRQG